MKLLILIIVCIIGCSNNKTSNYKTMINSISTDQEDIDYIGWQSKYLDTPDTIK